MKISEVAERTRLSISTIRYYEKTGICSSISRGADGKRQFTTTDLDWLLLLSSLRETGMPTSEMKQFAALYRKGNETVPERKRMLLKHAQHLEDRQTQLNRCTDILRRKLAKYDEITGK